jgi:hypothetical protein
MTLGVALSFWLNPVGYGSDLRAPGCGLQKRDDQCRTRSDDRGDGGKG